MIMIFTLSMIETKVCGMELPHAGNSMVDMTNICMVKDTSSSTFSKFVEGWSTIQELVLNQ